MPDKASPVSAQEPVCGPIAPRVPPTPGRRAFVAGRGHGVARRGVECGAAPRAPSTQVAAGQHVRPPNGATSAETSAARRAFGA